MLGNLYIFCPEDVARRYIWYVANQLMIDLLTPTNLINHNFQFYCILNRNEILEAKAKQRLNSHAKNSALKRRYWQN